MGLFAWLGGGLGVPSLASQRVDFHVVVNVCARIVEWHIKHVIIKSTSLLHATIIVDHRISRLLTVECVCQGLSSLLVLRVLTCFA